MDVHVLPAGQQWEVAVDGDALLTFGTRRSAINAGCEVAETEHGVLVVHGPDGRSAPAGSTAG